MMNAEEARKRTSQNKERKVKIRELIREGEKNIEYAVERGYRREATVHPGYCENDGTPQYPEVIEHFKKLGYEVKYCYGTSIYEIRW